MGIFQIAGLTVRMEPKEAILTQNSRAYRLDTASEIACSQVDMDLLLSSEQMEQLHVLHPQSPAQNIEYMYIGALFYHKLLTSFQGMMLHSSAVVYEGQAYLFSAPAAPGSLPTLDYGKNSSARRMFLSSTMTNRRYGLRLTVGLPTAPRFPAR